MERNITKKWGLISVVTGLVIVLLAFGVSCPAPVTTTTTPPVTTTPLVTTPTPTSTPTPTPTPTPTDTLPVLNGVWNLEVFSISSTCGPEPGWSSTITIVQEGALLETTGIKGTSFIVTGIVAGETVTFGPGFFPESGGTTMATYIMTIISDTLMEGTEEWTWTNGMVTCSNGTGTIRATKIE